MNKMKLLRFLLCGVLLLVVVPVCGQEAASELAHRILGARAKQVVFKLSPLPTTTEMRSLAVVPEGGWFRLSPDAADSRKICIEGDNDNSLCVGLNYYLRHYAHIYVSWYADEPIQLPKVLPAIDTVVEKKALVKERFFLNYCTYGYTMPWWKWQQWERFIDWMALNGITMPLASTGQEAVWYEVWTEMGLSDEQVRGYFSGPAHLPWHRMANLDGFGGPLPKTWIEGQKKLQQQILARERRLGMTPVLPAFSGHVPKQIAENHPTADIQRLSGWCGFEPTCFLNADDSLFAFIQRRYLEKQTALFGSDHIYGVDPFNEMNPPSWDPQYLVQVSKNIYASLHDVDSMARWLQMSWVFYYKRKQWTPERLRAYITAVPRNSMVLLDYFCENTEVWRTTAQSDSVNAVGFYGQPFIWCYLGNFGGNTMLVGNLKELEQKLSAALIESGGSMLGVGSTLESFDCSPQIYEYLFERVWESDADALNGNPRDSLWILDWADLRAGYCSDSSRAAWRTLRDSVYWDNSFYGLGSQLVARPSFDGHGTYYTKPFYSYQNRSLLSAIMNLWNAYPQNRDAYDYDMVNLLSQWLANRFMDIRNKFTVAYRNKNVAQMQRMADLANELFIDVDRLLCSHESFLLGKWIADARSWGKNSDEQNYYEQQARTLLTIWGGPILNDYANRLWGGMVKDYYAQRWNLFFDYAISAVRHDTVMNEQVFEQKLAKFERLWTLQHNAFSPKPTGNTRQIVGEILAKVPHQYADWSEVMLREHLGVMAMHSTLQDVYKSAFQDYFGPEHIIGSKDVAKRDILEEIKQFELLDGPAYQYTGLNANYVRVNLSLVRDGIIPADVFCDALFQSAKVLNPISQKEWKCIWEMMMVDLSHADPRYAPQNFSADSVAISTLLSKGKYVMHHSRQFNLACNFHYRLIRRDIFEQQLLKYINRK